jgi:two-component sensor histidine kinase
LQEFPINGGHMGAAIRAFDWSSTPLGSIQDWPVSLRSVVQTMVAQKQAICLFWGPQLTLLYNDAYAPMLGEKERHALGAPFRRIWSDVWEEVKPFVDTALSGEGTFTENLHLVMNRNGYEEDTWWTFSYSPLYDDHGKVAGLINVTVDTTQLVLGRQAQHVLQRELMHRVKNALAVTGAVVTSTIRSATSLEEARETVASRIAALSLAQDLLNASGSDVDVGTLVAETLQPHLDRPTRAILSGPSVRVSSQQAVGLSLAIYELATNAIKYGALSTERGAIQISWEASPGHGFRFVWSERGGPLVAVPARSGFGSKLTNHIVASYFFGVGETEYAPEGLRYVLSGWTRQNVRPENTEMADA